MMSHDTTSDSVESVTATPAQLFTGVEIGLPSLTVLCSRCDKRLREGDSVSVYAYRPVENSRWYVGRCCCSSCAPDRFSTPTLGTAECRINARLATISDVGTQHHSLCLIEPTVTAFASPATGAEPCGCQNNRS
jgi:hypothetical protein